MLLLVLRIIVPIQVFIMKVGSNGWVDEKPHMTEPGEDFEDEEKSQLFFTHCKMSF